MPATRRSARLSGESATSSPAQPTRATTRSAKKASEEPPAELTQVPEEVAESEERNGESTQVPEVAEEALSPVRSAECGPRAPRERMTWCKNASSPVMSG